MHRRGGWLVAEQQWTARVGEMWGQWVWVLVDGRLASVMAEVAWLDVVVRCCWEAAGWGGVLDVVASG